MLSQSPFSLKLPNHQKGEFLGYKAAKANLSEEQQAMIDAKQLKGSKTSRDWLKLLDGVILYDRAAAITYIKQKRLRLLFTILVSVTCIVILSNFSLGAFWWFIAFIGVVFLLAAVNQLFPDKYYKTLFPDYLYTVLSPLMIALQEETKADTLINLETSLQTQRHELYEVERFRRYEWPFLNISTTLNNKVDFQAIIHIQNLMPGRKSKRRVFLTISFSYPKKEFPTIVFDQLSNDKFKIKTKKKPKKHVLRIRKVLKYKDKPFDDTKYNDVPIDLVLEMMREGYKPIQ